MEEENEESCVVVMRRETPESSPSPAASTLSSPDQMRPDVRFQVTHLRPSQTVQRPVFRPMRLELTRNQKTRRKSCAFFIDLFCVNCRILYGRCVFGYTVSTWV